MSAPTTANHEPARRETEHREPDLGKRLFSSRADRRRNLEFRSLHALAALLLLVQLPHLMHLPIWISVLGAAVVGLRLYDLHRPGRALCERLLSPLALSTLGAVAALLIRVDYGYFLGRDPCVAFLFVLVAAKFAEVRRTSDTTLLLCLAAFLLLTQYFYSQSLISAFVTLPAVFALGNALVVMREPGRQSATAARLRLVGKLLLQGLPLATLLFFVFPRLPGPLWSLPEDSMATTGLSDSMSPGSIGALSQSGAVAFRVEFDDVDTIPPPALRYWRGPVLTDFDGRRWSTSPVRHFVSLDPREREATPGEIDYTVMLQPHRQDWMFALESPLSLPARTNLDERPQAPLARLTHDGQLIADKPVSSLVRYRQRSLPGAANAYARAPGDASLALAGRNPRTLAFADELRASQPDDSTYAHAVLQRFNEEPYRYTLSPRLLGDSPVDEFLFDTQEGFCEHYAAAFVVMMRAAGIPSRVVTGYLGGEMNGDYMIVRQSDAHAWAEAWIDDRWQRFEPTGAVAPSRIEHGLAAALPDSALVPRLGGGWLTSVNLRWDAVNHAWQRLVVDFDNDSQSAFWKRLGLPDPEPWQLVALVLAAAGLWCLAVLRLPELRRHDGLPPVEAAWRRFTAALEAQRIVRQPDERGQSYIRRAADALPDEGERIARIGHALYALRFSSQAPAQEHLQLAGLRADLRRLSTSLALARIRRQPTA